MSAHDINLTDSQIEFIDLQVRAGRHSNATEVIREALRRYEDDVEAEKATLAAVGDAAADGIAAIAADDFVTVSGEQGSRDLLDRLNREAAEVARRSG